jgi:hypothetical protein
MLRTCVFGGRPRITGGFEQQVFQFAHREQSPHVHFLRERIDKTREQNVHAVHLAF